MEKLKRIKENWLLLSWLVTITIAIFTFCHNVLNQFDELKKAITTTKQMALKSIIWNQNIPVAERISTCDIYINAGYNSLTKKECEVIIELPKESR